MPPCLPAAGATLPLFSRWCDIVHAHIHAMRFMAAKMMRAAADARRALLRMCFCCCLRRVIFARYFAALLARDILTLFVTGTTERHSRDDAALMPIIARARFRWCRCSCQDTILRLLCATFVYAVRHDAAHRLFLRFHFLLHAAFILITDFFCWLHFFYLRFLAISTLSISPSPSPCLIATACRLRLIFAFFLPFFFSFFFFFFFFFFLDTLSLLCHCWFRHFLYFSADYLIFIAAKKFAMFWYAYWCWLPLTPDYAIVCHAATLCMLIDFLRVLRCRWFFIFMAAPPLLSFRFAFMLPPHFCRLFRYVDAFAALLFFCWCQSPLPAAFFFFRIDFSLLLLLMLLLLPIPLMLPLPLIAYFAISLFRFSSLFFFFRCFTFCFRFLLMLSFFAFDRFFASRLMLFSSLLMFYYFFDILDCYAIFTLLTPFCFDFSRCAFAISSDLLRFDAVSLIFSLFHCCCWFHAMCWFLHFHACDCFASSFSLDFSMPPAAFADAIDDVSLIHAFAAMLHAISPLMIFAADASRFAAMPLFAILLMLRRWWYISLFRAAWYFCRFFLMPCYAFHFAMRYAAICHAFDATRHVRCCRFADWLPLRA